MITQPNFFQEISLHVKITVDGADCKGKWIHTFLVHKKSQPKFDIYSLNLFSVPIEFTSLGTLQVCEYFARQMSFSRISKSYR